MKIAVIGDIHGCYDKLQQLLDKLEKENINRYIFLGDYFDRGQKSKDVYLKLKEMKESLKDDCILCYGNHEDMLIRWFYNKRWASDWFNNGGQETLYSFGIMDFYEQKQDIKPLVEWIQNNTQYIYDCGQFSCCHAYPVENFNKDSEDDMEYLIWDRDSFRNCLYNGKLAFIGHTPVEVPVLSATEGGKPFDYDVEYEIPSTGLIDIDTAAAYKGFLTAAIVDMDKNTVMFIKDLEEK